MAFGWSDLIKGETTVLLSSERIYIESSPYKETHNDMHVLWIFISIQTSVAWGQVWTQKCAVQKASVDVNISYYLT